jgi:hypothetical protein
MKSTLISQFIATLVLFLAIGCSQKTTEVSREEEEAKEKTIQATEAFPSLRFTAPVDLQHAGDGTGRLFVVEQAGIIKVFENTSSTSTASVFLDIKSKVTAGGERGLLGLAFHPDFKNNGWFYVNYTRGNPLTTVIARYQTNNPAGNQADPNSETILLTFSQRSTIITGAQCSLVKTGISTLVLVMAVAAATRATMP